MSSNLHRTLPHRKPKSSSTPLCCRRRKLKLFQSHPIRLLFGLAAVGNGVAVGSGSVAAGHTVRIRVQCGCKDIGVIATITACGLAPGGAENQFRILASAPVLISQARNEQFAEAAVDASCSTFAVNTTVPAWLS